MTNAYKITGGRAIEGKITCLGAKNFATKAMVAALLSPEKTLLTNVPDIGDVHITADMIVSSGVNIEFDHEAKTMLIDPSSMTRCRVDLPQSGSNRIPILMIGALLNRFKRAEVPMMAGCNIGDRKIDFHTRALEQFGALVDENADGFVATCNNRLKGTHIELPYPSVGATETCLFLSVWAEGTSVISNAAVEPEIGELITMLRSMGAIIFTTPERQIIVHGMPELNGTRMEILGDRIDAASWASLACASNGNITLKGIRPETLNNFLSYYQQVGGGIEFTAPDEIRFFRKRKLSSTMIETDVYPGFSTDWQQPFAILLTQAEGVSVIHETVYEKRFGYLKALNQLGADTQLATYCLGSTKCRYKDMNYEHSAIIKGCTPLKSDNFTIRVPDLRAGLAYVIAAAIAEGSTIITNIENIERGYGDIIQRTKETSLQIEKLKI
jgi:UDP-N-acetylglucosamine 1-carboxyvinyltransferase